MSVNPMPGPSAGPVPLPSPEPVDGTAPKPQPKFTPNPYQIPDRVVSDSARSEAERQSAELSARAQQLWNDVLGDDLHVATDPKQQLDARMLHAGLAAATILTLPGAPEALGLKLAAKETLKGGIEHLTFHAVGKSVAGGELLLQGGVKLTPDEAKIAAEFARRGHQVISKAPSALGKSADFVIDGRLTELKTISHVKATARPRPLRRRS